MTRAAACGVVVASVPWAEPGSRSTRDFESERAWPMSVANQKTVPWSSTTNGIGRYGRTTGTAGTCSACSSKR